jgi:hypothetical protein
MIQSIATSVTAVGVVVAVLGLRASQRQRLRQFENLYVQRYWALMDKLSLEALRGVVIGEPNEDDEKIVRAYFRLCEDQIELRCAGWISDSSWSIWFDGMRAQLKRQPFQSLWEKVQDESPAEFTLLREWGREEKATGDPCAMPRWRRQLTGLGGRTSV